MTWSERLWVALGTLALLGVPLALLAIGLDATGVIGL